MVLGCGYKGLSKGVELRSKLKSIRVLALQITQAQKKRQNYFGRRNSWNKIQKWILFVWTECVGCTKVGGGILGKFHHRRHGKIQKGSKPNKSPKTKRVFFLKETKSKERIFLRGQTQKMVFRKGLNDLLSNQARVLSENKITKILECHSTYPLRKNLVPEISADP